ncbi:PucR family transcriptional regulator [Brevibacillus sp. FSL L8-0710]|uniref:PucR family transcriptional regulator n=1 Tax=Brevibacillus sp. FSL L8-0710 TaxID=2975313 RepID=UPI0030FA56B7
MNDWKYEVDKIRQATNLPISYLCGTVEQIRAESLRLEEEGWEIVAQASSSGQCSIVMIPSTAWEGVPRALLSLMFSEKLQAASDQSQLANWLHEIALGAPTPPPAGLAKQLHWQEPRVPFLLEQCREGFSWHSLAPILPDFFKGASLSQFPLPFPYLLLAVPLSALGSKLDEETGLEWASGLHDLFSTECMENVRVIVGEPVGQPPQLGDALTQALTLSSALRKFRPKTMVASVRQFPLERWVMMLGPETTESLQKAIEEMIPLPQLNAEQVETLETFFARHLNVSETARQLFLHRNTLLYRLDKLTEQTGLDPRQFTEAVLLQLLLLFRQK